MKDVIVLTLPDGATYDVLARARRALEQAFPETTSLILPHGARLEAVSPPRSFVPMQDNPGHTCEEAEIQGLLAQVVDRLVPLARRYSPRLQTEADHEELRMHIRGLHQVVELARANRLEYWRCHREQRHGALRQELPPDTNGVK